MMYNMHLIINTHWDREYRWSFAETQMRLAEAVDDLIDIMNRDPEFKNFHTDSQVSMLDDYLDIRPERTEELKRLVADGRILTGPWYTLPAEFLVSGESLVRNLNLGHKISKELGKVMKVAYNIFSWGQVSQLPQIYKQFGMDTIIFYRGVDQSKLDRLEFKWKAPDGTEAIGLTFGAYHRLNFWRLVYLPYILGGDSVEGENYKISRNNLKSAHMTHICDSASDMVNHRVLGQGCAKDINGAVKGLKELIDTVKDKSSTPDLLFLQGFDQENPDPIVTELVKELNEKTDYGKIEITDLESYVKTLKADLEKEGLKDKLDVLEGEMLEVERVGDAFGPLYNGVFSARIPIKIRNNRCEALLTGWSEPAAVFNMLSGGEYPRVPLSKAWKELLKNHQHDGIGGCHIDRVTVAMEERYNKVCDIGDSIVRNSLVELTANIDFSRLGEKEIGLAVFNSMPVRRKEVVNCVVDVPADWGFRWSGTNRRDFNIEARDSAGNFIPCSVSKLDDDYVFGYLKFGNVMGYQTTRCYISVLVDVPPCGFTSVTLTPKKLKGALNSSMVYSANCMQNENLRVEINENGSLDITDLKTGKTFKKMNYFEDSSDKGGPLRYDPAYEAGVMNTLSERPEIKLIRNNALEAVYRITYRWNLPESIEAPLRIHVPHGSEWVEQGPLQRSERYVEETIVTEVSLKKGGTSVDISTKVDNKARDHRLRVMFPTMLENAAESIADSPFDVVKRPIAIPDSTGWYEEASRTWPTKSLVAVSDGDGTTCVVKHDCFTEYEVTDNADRAIALTMLRCFSTAGNPTETFCYQELAECIGSYTYNYAIEFANTADTAELLRSAQKFTTPVHTAQTTAHKGTFSAEKSFINLKGDSFIVTAVKAADNDNAIVLRGYLESNKDGNISLELGFDVKKAEKITLEESAVCDIAVENNTLSLQVGAKEIVGIKLYI